MKKQHEIWMENFLENCRLLNKSEHTIKNYKADLLKFFLWFELRNSSLISIANGSTITLYKDFLLKGGSFQPSKKDEKKIKKIFSNFFKKFLEIVSKNKTDVDDQSILEHELTTQQPLAVSSRRRHLSALKNFFEFLKQVNEDEGKIFEKNPVKSKIHAIKLKDIDVNHTTMLNRDDWVKIDMYAQRPQERLIVYLLYWGGLRLSELCELKISCFDLKTQTLCFARKGGSVHTLAIQRNDTIFEYLHQYLRVRKHDSPFLFPNRDGNKISSRGMYKKIMKIFTKSECSADLTPHSFRKACATNLYLKKKDLLVVRDYLNHADAKVTQTYIDRGVLESENRVY